jgi:hypothetical protein
VLTSKTTQTMIFDRPHLDRQRRSRVGIEWRRRSECEKRRHELLGNVLLLQKLLGKSRSLQNGTNTKTVLQSICKRRARASRPVRRTISFILACEERKLSPQRPLRIMFIMPLHLPDSTVRTRRHEDHQHDPKRAAELQIHLGPSRVGDHRWLSHILFRHRHLLPRESRVYNRTLQHRQHQRNSCGRSLCLADRKLKIILDTRRYLPYLEQRLSLVTEDEIEVAAD